MRRFLLSPTLLLMVLMSHPLRAQDTPTPDMLFTELSADGPSASVDLASIRLRENENPAITRSRLAGVNFDLLDEGDAEQIDLNLFEDARFLGVREDLRQREAGGYTWIGRIAEIPVSQVIIVVEDQSMAVHIMVDGKKYAVRQVEDGLYTIREMNPEAFPGFGEPRSPSKSNGDSSIPEQRGANFDVTPTATTYVDLLVVYTDDAADASGNILTEIQLAVDQTNVAYANSGINHRLRLVRAEQVAYSETGDIDLDHDRLTFKDDGYMDNVHSLRDTYGADVVSLIVEDGGPYAGIAWLMTNQMIGSQFEGYAFNVVVREWASSHHVLAHEIGHNMGADHDRYVSTGDGAYDYSHGYVSISGRWVTIMAYHDACIEAGVNCFEIPHFSNPNVLYNGVPTGVAALQPDAADNSRTLNITAPTVAAFRGAVVPPPPPGTTVTLTSVADAFVRGGTYANTNYGRQTDLYIRKSSLASATREAYVKFNLSSVSGTITSAKMRLFPFDAGRANQVHNAALVTNDTWGERTITWNNKPPSSTALGSWTVVEGRAVEIDVTGFAREALATDKLLSVRIFKPTNGTSTDWVRYGSRQSSISVRRPKLVLTLSSGAQLVTDLQEGSTASVSSISARGPLRFALEQNRPNPFNSTTEIQFALPEVAKVRLVIYDVLGREVRRVVDESMTAGVHTVRLDASGLPSGLYMYRLTAGSFVQARRMILIK